jgi:hypothetical protein
MKTKIYKSTDMSKVMTEKDYGHLYPIKALYHGFDVSVRKMRQDEMPDDGNTYYVDVDGSIYSHDAYPDDVKYFKLIQEI